MSVTLKTKTGFMKGEQVRYSPHLQLRLERPIDSVPPHLELGVKEEGLRPRIFRVVVPSSL